MVMSAHGNVAGVGVQQVPRERAAALVVSENAISDGILHLQPHLIECFEVEDDCLAGRGLAGSLCCSDYRVAVEEQADLKSPEGDRQVVREDVGAVDGGSVDAGERVEVPLQVGEDMWESDGPVLPWK